MQSKHKDDFEPIIIKLSSSTCNKHQGKRTAKAIANSTKSHRHAKGLAITKQIVGTIERARQKESTRRLLKDV